MGLRSTPELGRRAGRGPAGVHPRRHVADQPEACLAAARDALAVGLQRRRPADGGLHHPGLPEPAGDRPRGSRPTWAASWTATRRASPRPWTGRGPSTPARLGVSWRQVAPSEGQYRWDLFDAQLAWCRRNRLAIEAGPLIEFRKGALPDWLWLWEGDFETIGGLVADFVRQAVSRYKGKVPLWHVVHRAASGEILGLTEEEQVRIAARAVQVARQADPSAQVTIGVDRPWAEWMGSSHFQLGPLHLCDYLLRAELGISGDRDRDRPGYPRRAATSATCSSSPSCWISTRC